MKCINCGAELSGKFCTVCGTPANAQPQTEPVAQEAVQNVEPMQYNPAPQQDLVQEAPQQTPAQEMPPQPEPMQYNSVQNVDPVQYNQTQQPQQQYTHNTVAPDYSQQYQNYGGVNTGTTNGYTGQQFTNQPNNNPTVNPQGKKPMSTGKIVGLVLGIVGGVVLLICILIGVAACRIIQSTGDLINDIYDYGYDYYDYGYDLDDFMSNDNAENNAENMITCGGEYWFAE